MAQQTAAAQEPYIDHHEHQRAGKKQSEGEQDVPTIPGRIFRASFRNDSWGEQLRSSFGKRVRRESQTLNLHENGASFESNVAIRNRYVDLACCRKLSLVAFWNTTSNKQRGFLNVFSFKKARADAVAELRDYYLVNLRLRTLPSPADLLESEI